jgi:hypothetical protein
LLGEADICDDEAMAYACQSEVGVTNLKLLQARRQAPAMQDRERTGGCRRHSGSREHGRRTMYQFVRRTPENEITKEKEQFLEKIRHD